ncbi:hypothetical protein F4804DRAFT_225251 [Jackrogersella minutella]|nr:hypothetical protein F4804DRAFT_225251 [Jackrogersella minutella]
MPGTVEPESTAPGDSPTIELPLDETPPRHYVVFNQNVDIEIDFAEKRVHGRSDILIVPTADISEVFIDARQCEIDVTQITVSNCEVKASYQDPCEHILTPENYRLSAHQWAIKKRRMEPLLHHKRKEVSALDHDLKCCTPLNGSIRVQLPSVDEVLEKNRNSLKSDQQDLLLHNDGKVGGYRIRIPFKLRNTSDGLQFVGCNEVDNRYPHVYTRHSVEPGTASAIFPCIDDPGSRNSWRISVTCPRTLGDAFCQAQQQPKGFGDLNGGRKRKRGEEEPQKSERAEIALTEEEKMLDMTVVCAGYLSGEVVHKEDETKKTMTFEIDRNKAAKHIGFAVGPFEHVDLWSEFRSEEDDTKLGGNAVKVHGYCLPGRAEEVKNTCCALVTAIDYFVLTFGRYPFESYKVCFVDDMIEETIPLCAFSLCSTRLLYPDDIIDTEVETTRKLVYSLASQWFGVNIVPNTKGDIWLVVGIAWFLTDHFMKMLCGNNEYRFRMKSMADKLVETDLKRPCLQDLGEHLYLGDFEIDFMNLKAPLVLFILDRRLSKSSSSTGISKIIYRMVSKANTSGQASDEVLGSDAFRRACEKAGNSRLEQFWNQWVFSSGCPRFSVTQRFNKKRLCVEMKIEQKQDDANSRKNLNKNDLWRGVMEEHHAVCAGELQKSFTGPMTIRIHEADGTPYEHIVEIREDPSRSVKFDIPYNTKYKRLKRNRRQRERAMASSSRGHDDPHKELYYLGDVMQHPDEMQEWGFCEWDDDVETAMDQESYEWIRMDADFEWICEMKTDLPPYMYASQLQQDRDVVAQQDSILFLHEKSLELTHRLISTILTRTVLDTQYYYGVRLMAADSLHLHAKASIEWCGLDHLIHLFRYFFCQEGTTTPLPNDFSDKRQYLVQCAIPESLARIRGEDGKCPARARRFILEQLQSNDNTNNVYSDQLYICRLLKALAICQIPDENKAKQQGAFQNVDDDDMMGEPAKAEANGFRDLVIEEIDRFRRMDEYAPSYENCFTIAALDAYCHMMKAKVIPKNPTVFAEYLQDRTYDVVRIKACECLVEIGMLSNKQFLRLFLTLASTDPSPFVRDQIFKVLCRSLASIAIGEAEEDEKETLDQPAQDDIIVEKDTAIMDARQKAKSRKQDLSVALAALKQRTTDDETLQNVIWNAMESPVLTISERINFLELCSILFVEDLSLPLVFKYPTYWTVVRGERVRNKCLLTFKRHYRTKSRKPRAVLSLASKVDSKRPEPKRTITLNLNRSMSSSARAATPSATVPPPLPPAPPAVTPGPRPSGVVPTPRPAIPSLNKAAAPKDKTPKDKTPKDKTSLPSVKESSSEEPAPKKVKHSATAPISRGATPSGAQERPRKSESFKDSISVQTPVRPTIEPRQPESKPGPSRPNGSAHQTPAGPSRPSKRPSAESDSSRPTKIVRLNTSRIPRRELERVSQPPPSRPRKLVTVKFTAWDRLRRRQGNTSQAGSIRATPKHRRPEDRSSIRSPRPSAGAPSPVPRISESTTASSSQNPTTTPHTSQSATHSSASGGKPRKPLPEMRKALPSAAPATNNPTPLKQPTSATAPASTPKGPTKLKIKVKPPAAGSSSG